MFRRNLQPALDGALSDTPVVLIAGARQTGKSTLARGLGAGANYYTFDDQAILSAARSDPQAFIASLPRPVVLDEVQLLPELFRAIKYHVDRDRTPGSFVLTGSANVLLLPRLAETLAGRMEVLTLWPLSQGEIASMKEGFIDAAFGEAPPVLGPSRMAWAELIGRVLDGGFPEVVQRANAARVRAWFRAYTTTVLQRHVSDIANIDALGEMPRVLSLIGAEAMGIANASRLGRDLGLPATSMSRYLDILRASYVVQGLPGWSSRLNQRVMKTERLTLLDSGVLGYLQNVSAERIPLERMRLGPLLQTFVLMELRKQLGWSDTLAELYYFRTHGGAQADLVLEASDGRVIGIDVKSGMTLERRDHRGLDLLREELGDRFVRGIILYTGEATVPFGDRTWAMPIDALWRWGATPS